MNKLKPKKKLRTKILHYTNSYFPFHGGIELVIENISKELNKKGFQNDILTLNSVYGEKLPKKGKHNNSNIYRIPFIDFKYYKFSKIPFDLIKKYDIIHLHSLGFLSDFLLATKPIHKKKIVLSTHGGIFHTKNVQTLKKIYFFGLQKQLLKNADKIIAVSQQDEELFKQILPKEKVVLIENGFSAPEPKGKKEMNSFLFVGRLSKNKGLFDLIDTFSKVEEEFILRIVGKDFDKILPELKAKVKQLGLENKVFFIGEASVEKLNKPYSKSEYFVSASKYEGFGITAIEAMHYKCICILNSIPTFTQFCSKGRGVIVNYKEHKETAEKIEELLGKNTKEKEKFIKNAKAYSKQFLWKQKIKEYEKFYKSII